MMRDAALLLSAYVADDVTGINAAMVALPRELDDPVPVVGTPVRANDEWRIEVVAHRWNDASVARRKEPQKVPALALVMDQPQDSEAQGPQARVARVLDANWFFFDREDNVLRAEAKAALCMRALDRVLVAFGELPQADRTRNGVCIMKVGRARIEATAETIGQASVRAALTISLAVIDKIT